MPEAAPPSPPKRSNDFRSILNAKGPQVPVDKPQPQPLGLPFTPQFNDPNSIGSQLGNIGAPLFNLFSRTSPVQQAGESAQDFYKRRTIADASAMAGGMASRIGVNPAQPVEGKILNILSNSLIDPLLREKEAPQEFSRFYTEKMGKYFSPEEMPEVNKYMETISAWKGGNQGLIRDAMNAPISGNTPGQPLHPVEHLYTKEWGRDITPVEAADRLTRLYNQSNHQSTGPLYRFSMSMGEFPQESLVKHPAVNQYHDPRWVPPPGTVFYQQPVSYSSTPNWPRTSVFRTYWRDAPMMMIEPGAKTLPIGGVEGFPNEYEHIVGGMMKVIESNPKFVRLRQIGPVLAPRKP